jgi:hypothetical protein
MIGMLVLLLLSFVFSKQYAAFDQTGILEV